MLNPEQILMRREVSNEVWLAMGMLEPQYADLVWRHANGDKLTKRDRIRACGAIGAVRRLLAERNRDWWE